MPVLQARPVGGGVRMFGFAVACDRYDPRIIRCVSGWPRRRVARSHVTLRPAVPIAGSSATFLRPLTRFAANRRLVPPDEAAKYADHARHRLVVTPGLTGSGRAAGKRICQGEKPARPALADRRR